MAQSVLETGKRAFAAFAEGWLTGNFQTYIDMLAAEVEFWYPAGSHHGQFSGAAGRAEMIAKCNDHTAAGDRLTFTPTYVTANDTIVVIEFSASGVFQNQPYQGWNAIALGVTGNQISAFREYFGNLGK